MKEQQENEAKVLEKLVNKTKKIRETYMKKFRVKKPYEYDTYGEGIPKLIILKFFHSVVCTRSKNSSISKSTSFHHKMS